MATEGLSAHHQDQVKCFLKFFRGKLQLHINALESDFQDTITDRLSDEDMYTQEEVAEVVKSLCCAIQSSVRGEFQACINMSALLLRQVFDQADDSDIELQLDTSLVEDRSLLEKVQRLRVDEPSSEASNSKRRVAKLKNKSNDLQNQVDDLLQENKKLNATQKELQEMADEAQQHVSKSKQFIQMKSLLAQKNQQVRELRQRLLTYEPDIAFEEEKAESKY